jgi:hypothetical protein
MAFESQFTAIGRSGSYTIHDGTRSVLSFSYQREEHVTDGKLPFWLSSSVHTRLFRMYLSAVDIPAAMIKCKEPIASTRIHTSFPNQEIEMYEPPLQVYTNVIIRPSGPTGSTISVPITLRDCTSLETCHRLLKEA